ncbi:glycoside hydrolase family 16 protein [Noviherbaspirillum denitrificans]|uniref:GH16 domain-containing protein n=1 Tax=Noviherbaspirillum denitrificans TaxID=1968433 RepID=A0A254TEQ6_9BURK|nr:glycoside hydrolase family 16 protein [Noviherbaspirillum denitrificans]OWW21121.1 hypothetical protein AYR66_18230 [Noviherbaspirillum denitrificans]
MTAATRVFRTVIACALAVAGFSACGEEPAFDAQKVAALAAKSKRAQAEQKTPYGQKASDFVLTFAEEFDSFNPAVWNDHIWYETPNPTKNFTVEKGVLKIWPQRDASGKFFNRTLDTDGKFEQKYGYFEMEAKLLRGKGTWPAFWLFAHPGKRRPEIDIMEAYPGGIDPWGYTDDAGVSRPTAYGATVWLDEGVSAGTRQIDAGKDLSAGFHKYGAKWEPGRVTFYLDGKQTYAVDANMTDPMYILVDLWFGSSSGDPDESTPAGKANSFEVNYIRAWQFRNHD